MTLENPELIKDAHSTDITSRKQFFVDNYIIESMSNITRVVNAGKKYESTVISPEYVWEGIGTEWPTAYIAGTVLYDSQESLYKMWYTSCYIKRDEMRNIIDERYLMCYAISNDGDTWTKPLNLGVYEFNGSKNNNIVRDSRLGSGTVFKDLGEHDPDKRYKMFGYKGRFGGNPDGYYIFYSQDGIHWTDGIPAYEGLLDMHDVCTTAYDPIKSQYISSIKYWPQPLISTPRVQMTSTSVDFATWTAPELTFVCDAEDKIDFSNTDIYGMGLYPTDGGYFGFPWIFYHNIGSDDGPVDVQLAFSRDAYNWIRPSRMPVIPLGTAGSFDAGSMYTAAYPIEVGDQVRLYYGGFRSTHDAQGDTAEISYASWRKDGFVSLNAGSAEGTLLTKLVRFAGRNDTLFLNVDASGGGSVKVEMLDINDRVLTGFSRNDCDAITVDELNHEVTWNGYSDISALQGQVIKLKIYMTNARLYALKTNCNFKRMVE